MASRKQRDATRLLRPAVRDRATRMVATVPPPKTIPADAPAAIVDEIRRRAMIDDQARAIQAIADELGVDPITLRLFKSLEHVKTIDDIRRIREPSPAQIVSMTPEWREAHAEGMRQPTTREEADARLQRQRDRSQNRRYKSQAARRARLRDAIIEPINRTAIIERDNRTCYLCGRTNLSDQEIHLDHYIPLAKGGEHTERNLRVSCAPCNIRKGSTMPTFDRATLAALRLGQHTNE